MVGIIILKGIVFAVAIFLTLSIGVDAKLERTSSGGKVLSMLLSWVFYSTLWAIFFMKVMG